LTIALIEIFKGFPKEIVQKIAIFTYIIIKKLGFTALK